MNIKIKTEDNHLKQNSMNICGKWIRYVRMGHYDKNHPRISQEDLVARLQTRGFMINRSSPSRIENGSRGLSDIEVLCFADALKVPVTFLYKGVNHHLPRIEGLISLAAEETSEVKKAESTANDEIY